MSHTAQAPPKDYLDKQDKSKISRGSKGTVVSSQGFMREHFTVLFDNGITVTELVSSDLKETDLGFFRLGARR
jgi:hypothetical protein